MPVDHYENFPVASLLLPARLRKPIETIYWFARNADDIADEGEWPPEERLKRLSDLRAELRRIESGEMSKTPWGERLNDVIRAHALPVQPFHDLLDAFSQDVVKARYRDWPDLAEYCRRSANPVGRLILHLHNAVSDENLTRSDAVCTSLQLINFWQDIAVDWRKGRVYLPCDEMRTFGVTDFQIAEGRCDDRFRALLGHQVGRARELMRRGQPLARALGGRIGLELKLIIAGGLRILEKLERHGYDMFRHRPRLTSSDWPLLCWRAAVA